MGKVQQRVVPATEPPSGTRFIVLTRGYIAVVDGDDFDLVSQKHWRAVIDKSKRQVYAASGVSGSNALKLHRVIVSAKPGEIVDHRDGDSLNNRRSNLRICTARQNMQNMIISPNQKTGGYKGVSKAQRGPSWTAKIRGGEPLPNGGRKKIYLGSFPSAESAALAYDRAAIELFGEFAACNFPKSRMGAA